MNVSQNKTVERIKDDGGGEWRVVKERRERESGQGWDDWKGRHDGSTGRGRLLILKTSRRLLASGDGGSDA
jgi:hypothetical protein